MPFLLLNIFSILLVACGGNRSSVVNQLPATGDDVFFGGEAEGDLEEPEEPNPIMIMGSHLTCNPMDIDELEKFLNMSCYLERDGIILHDFDMDQLDFTVSDEFDTQLPIELSMQQDGLFTIKAFFQESMNVEVSLSSVNGQALDSAPSTTLDAEHFRQESDESEDSLDDQVINDETTSERLGDDEQPSQSDSEPAESEDSTDTDDSELLAPEQEQNLEIAGSFEFSDCSDTIEKEIDFDSGNKLIVEDSHIVRVSREEFNGEIEVSAPTTIEHLCVWVNNEDISLDINVLTDVSSIYIGINGEDVSINLNVSKTVVNPSIFYFENGEDADFSIDKMLDP